MTGEFYFLPCNFDYFKTKKKKKGEKGKKRKKKEKRNTNSHNAEKSVAVHWGLPKDRHTDQRWTPLYMGQQQSASAGTLDVSPEAAPSNWSALLAGQ